MYIRILKLHNRYVAELIKNVVIDENLQSFCEQLGKLGVKTGMIIKNELDDKALKFDDSEMGIIKKFIPS